ncbi:hypothetical protein RM6536_1307 [Rothia mucilaginosa]|uniref:Uncharacterized protein n=1 Tax=Rothia mucilaginosa TaxID=43675 RepID=A0A0K2S0F6_9MICC|nr:hypothetical protein RM6536_1307 [Rothia mucilaginosa]
MGRGRSHRIGAFQQRRRTKELQGTMRTRQRSLHAMSVPYLTIIGATDEPQVTST